MPRVHSSTFFLQWVAAVTVTMIVAMMVAFVSMWSIGEWVAQAWGDGAGAVMAGSIFGALLGAGLGAGQAIVLRAQSIPLAQWSGRTALAGSIGMAIGFTTMFALLDVETVPQTVTGLVIALSAGLPVGLVQWAMLKPQMPYAQLWPLICIVAFLIAFIVGLPLGGEGREWLSVGVVALLTAIVTGAGFLWLARAGDTAVAA